MLRVWRRGGLLGDLSRVEWLVDLVGPHGYTIGQVNAEGRVSASLTDDSCVFASREAAETAAALYALLENANDG